MSSFVQELFDQFLKPNPINYIEPKIIPTQDGSGTLYVESLDETYHSTHGALQESIHVFKGEGLDFLISKGQTEIKIFEMGFGTGLNALLAFILAQSYAQLRIEYHSIEKYPVHPKLLLELGYQKIESLEAFKDDYKKILSADWNESVELSPGFNLKKILGDFFAFEGKSGFYDLIFYDAFGARAQEEMWEPNAFRICADLLKKGGYLVTYASKGSARRALEEVGFDVEKVPGPPGKREMMRAKYLGE